jgi:RNA polymerase sigma-70 factor (ECF subfamily)
MPPGSSYRGPVRNPQDPGGVPPKVISRMEAETADAERALVASFRAGDEGAFEEIVSRHRRRLFGIALRRTGDAAVAEDAVQMTFVQAWKHLPRMEGEIDLTAWLTTVVSNAALDQLRRDKRHLRLAQRAFEAAPERPERRGTERSASGDAPAVSRIDREDLGQILLEGIRSLPEPYRVALDLFHVQGLSVEEVSRALALNENTVKSHLARGRGLLRKRLGSALEKGGWL